MKKTISNIKIYSKEKYKNNNLIIKKTKLTWMEYYELAKTYYNYYGNLNIIAKFKTINGINYDENGFPLGTWIITQRQKRKNDSKLTDEQIELLDKINMRWDNIDRMSEWMEKYNLAKTYYEHHGNLEIPFDFKTKDGINFDNDGFSLGTWIIAQRQVRKGNYNSKITDEQINLLDKIDMRWDKIDTIGIWMKRYDLAKTYYKHHGNLEIPYDFKTVNGYDFDENGFGLGTWLHTQRLTYRDKNSKLTDEQINLLNEIGMRWDNITSNERWMKNYNLIKNYYDYNGNLSIPIDFKTKNGINYDEDGYYLRNWIHNQRQALLENNSIILTKEQIKLLKKIGISHENADILPQWLKKYELAKTYYNHYGNLEIPYDFKTTNGIDRDENGIAIGYWIANQRHALKNKYHYRITDKQINLLNEIGMRWDNIDRMSEWMQKYNLAKAYYEYYKNLEIPTRFKTTNGINYDKNGIALGNWIMTQRLAYQGNSNNKITDKQIELLNEINMRWNNMESIDKWMQKYNLAKAYYEHYHNLDIPYNFKTKNGIDYTENGFALGTWLNNQRQAYKGNSNQKITDKQISLLEKIAINWFSNNKFEKEEITSENLQRKNIEMKNRLYSLLSKYEDSYLPSKEELNNNFNNELSSNKK